jgi:hypothetical protein
MRAPVIILGVLLPMLGGYTIFTQLDGATDRRAEPNPPQAASPVPYETQALAGSWGGFLKSDLPIRLVVQGVHPEWALVLLEWGKSPEGSTAQGSLWTHAKVLPDGRLCISFPLNLIFTLSEDSRNLVGTTVHSDPLASVLLSRTEEEQARTTLSP